MTSNVTATEEPITGNPKYYEVDGALKANANRAWLLAFLTVPIALLAIGFAIFVRLQPPTVIRIGPNGEAVGVGPGNEGGSDRPGSRRHRSISQRSVREAVSSALISTTLPRTSTTIGPAV